jgi:hypothetical protein
MVAVDNFATRSTRITSVPKVNLPIKIFLSHSADDGQLVLAVEALLTGALNITSASIFCSSLEGQGVSKGGNFVEAIRDKANEADAVVALITPSYMESAFCLAELGAAWVLNTNRFPIVVPPNTFEVMKATLLGVVGVKINEEEALTQLIEDIGNTLQLTPPAAAVRLRAIRAFVAKWPDLKDTIGKAKRVDAIVHDKALTDLKISREALDATEAELKVANQKNAALLKTRDRAEAEAALKQFENSDWEMDLDNLVSEVSGIASEVGGDRILKLMILHVMGKQSIPDPRDDDVTRAVEINVFDPDAQEWVSSSDEMKKLKRAMKKVSEFLEQNDEAIAALKHDKKRYETNDIRFWEEHARLRV